MKFNYTNSNILNSQPGPLGFVVDNGKYAAIPLAGSSTKLMVIYDNCTKTKVCRNAQSARNFIDKLRKRRK